MKGGRKGRKETYVVALVLALRRVDSEGGVGEVVGTPALTCRTRETVSNGEKEAKCECEGRYGERGNG